MKIFFCGGNLAYPIVEWLKKIGEEVLYTEKKIDIDFIKKYCPDWIISYNYKYIIKKDVIDCMPNKIINLHISYLPYNKGAHPNIWSIIEDTPRGVTIHYIDEGIDTGDILVQKKVNIIEEETLKNSYEKLHYEIQMLFKQNWDKIKHNYITAKSQDKQAGTIHFIKDFNKIRPLLSEKGWDISIKEFKEIL